MRTLGKRFVEFIVGAIELAALIVLTGGFSDSYNDFGDVRTLGDMVYVSLLCTFGLSLIIWIPLLVLAGHVTLKVLGLQTSVVPPVSQAPEAPAQARAGSPNVPSVAHYIERMQRDGVADEVIRDRLRSAGWTDEAIGLAGGARG